jgi:cation:H+ antiporter
LLSGPIRVARRELGRDFTLALAVPPFTFMLAMDGTLSRTDGGLLLGVFCAWLAVSFYSGFRAQGLAGNGPSRYRLRTVLALAGGGLIALVLAARLFVAGATGIASAMGVDTYVIGAMLVAVGTSLPELMTVIVSRRRGHDEVGIGTLLGSNLFNGLAIVGIAATIHPMPVPVAEIAIALVIGVVVLLMMMPDRIGLLGRIRGVELLLVYLIFVLATLAASGYSAP